MESMYEILEDLVKSITMDAASSMPGLFTAATLLRHLEFRYAGKGQGERLTKAQIAAFKSWVRNNCEKKIINGKVYFRFRGE